MNTGYNITLKSKATIEALCYEVEGGELGQDGVTFNYDVLHLHGFTGQGVILVGVNEYTDDSYAYIIKNSNGGKIYVHLDWIASFAGSPTTEHKELTPDLIQVTRKYLIEPSTGKLTLKSSLPTCSHCDALGTIKMEDGKYLCKGCSDKLTVPKNYSWTPTPYEFIGNQLPKDVENPIWYGLEIEMSTNKTKLGKYMYDYGQKLYLKQDSSIRGSNFNVELVSHPHSFTSLMSDGSWLSNIGQVDTNDSDENGCHVHISRTAFINDRHYSLFYFLMHKMEEIATKVGGRDLTTYCSLLPTGRVFSKTNRKHEGNGRSLFLNEQNDETIEARFFKGTTNVNKLKGYVQLLESVIKYTKYHPNGGTVKGWFEYTSQKSKKYKELLEVVGTISSDNLEIEVIYREPTRKHKKTKQLTLEDVNNIVEIKLKDGTVHKGVVKKVNSQARKFEFRNERAGTFYILFSTIESITLEEE